MFNIEKYLLTLPNDITELDISSRFLTFIPDLTRFIKLQKLYCFNNQLTTLPKLPQTLTSLFCSLNKLTYLPELPECLIALSCALNKLIYLPVLPQRLTKLYCGYNELTHLANLPQSLTELHCSGNQLTILPILPQSLIYLFCENNNPLIDLFDIDIYDLTEIIKHSEILYQWKHLYYSLQFKKQFRDWLYKKVREPRAMKKFHPTYLLENLTEETDLEEVLTNWIK